MQIRTSIAAKALATLVAIGLTTPAVASDPTPTFEQISPLPLDGITAPGSQVGLGPDGEPLIFYVSSGSPAVFSAVDARTGERTFEAVMPGASGSWAVDVTPNGDVYVGSYGEGRLFRYTPGSTSVEDLDQQVAGETFIWSVTHDEEGRVYGGTGQLGGHVFQYDPRTGRTRDYGPVPDTTNLIVRSITVADGTIYAGTGATPTITAIDVDSGWRTTIPLPEGAAALQYVYDLDVRGGLLFARFSRGGAPEPLHVYDIAAGQWIDAIDRAHGLFVSPVAEDGRTVFFVRDRTLHAYDLESRSYEPTSLTGVSDVRAFGFLPLDDGSGRWPGLSVVGADHQGGYFVYNPVTGEGEERSADVVGAPAPIRSLTTGPDGRIYFGSYLAGGLASFDTVTGEKRGFAPEVGQAEGMTTHDGALWVGTYPSGAIYRYDPSEPYRRGVNPSLELRLCEHGQSRPFAMASAGEHLAIGTVAANGMPGGGLTLLDTTSREHWFVDVVPGHSVVGLTYVDGVLYGATSVFGGAGAPRPSDTDARVFAYDVEERRLLWQVAPLAGTGAYGELVVDRHGTLWTHSPNSVVKIDPATGAVLATRTYEPYPWESIQYAWVGARLWIDPYTDRLDVVTQARAYSIDTESLSRAQWFRPASYGVLSNNGHIYLGRDTTAWEYTRSTARAASVTLSTRSAHPGDDVVVSLAGFGPRELVEPYVDGRSLGARHVGDDGSLRLTVHEASDASEGERSVRVVRPATNSQISVTYALTPWTCDTTVDGHDGRLTARPGVLCLSGTVTGPVEVGAGATLVADDATIEGPVTTTAAEGVHLTRTTVTGPVRITDTASTVELRRTSVDGPVHVTGTAGSLVIAGSEIDGPLVCAGNTVDATDADLPSTFDGPVTGQCAPLTSR